MLDEHLPPIGVIDSHTGGEPTRVVISGGPDLGSGPLPGRVALFRERFDDFRSTVACEPRGSDAAVGALLVPPTDPSCVCGVIFFNNVGYLGMCVHGTIGLAVTLGHLGRIGPGEHRIETPVGVVVATLIDSNHARVRNVVSFRTRRSVAVNVAGYGEVVGDVAWGGNWFFLVDRTPERLTLDNVERLTDITWRIRQALVAQGITGADGAEIDHIELFGAPGDLPADSRNFVLCPGKAYDRSPCGTGTSAKLACLAGDGKLRPGQVWRQASIVGSIFEGFVTAEQRATAEQQDAAGQFAIGEQQVFVPHITGSAYITAESTLLRHPADPFRGGIRA